MSTPLPNRTDSRVSALSEVKDQLVSYDASVSEWLVKDAEGNEERAHGALRRTYSEMRKAGLMAPSSVTGKSVVHLSAAGEELAKEWGID